MILLLTLLGCAPEPSPPPPAPTCVTWDGPPAVAVRPDGLPATTPRIIPTDEGLLLAWQRGTSLRLAALDARLAPASPTTNLVDGAEDALALTGGARGAQVGWWTPGSAAVHVRQVAPTGSPAAPPRALDRPDEALPVLDAALAGAADGLHAVAWHGSLDERGPTWTRWGPDGVPHALPVGEGALDGGPAAIAAGADAAWVAWPERHDEGWVVRGLPLSADAEPLVLGRAEAAPEGLALTVGDHPIAAWVDGGRVVLGGADGPLPSARPGAAPALAAADGLAALAWDDDGTVRLQVLDGACAPATASAPVGGASEPALALWEDAGEVRGALVWTAPGPGDTPTIWGRGFTLDPAAAAPSPAAAR